MTETWRRVRAVPLRAVPRVAAHLIGRQWHHLTAPRAPREISDRDFLRAVNIPTARRPNAPTPDEVIEHFRRPDRPRLLHADGAIIEAGQPGARARLIARAANVLHHRFNLLGSGPTDLGLPIDWRRDFKSGHVWPLEHHTRLRLVDLRAGFDVKVPWELSRFHHGVTLAQAYAFTKSALYADEFQTQVLSWISQNPPEFGPNWANAMEASIRAANWLAAYDILADAPSLTPQFHVAFLKCLLAHGRFILTHLESGWPGSNHYLADLCGLVWLGALLPEFREAGRWLKTGLNGLTRELRRQIHNDGTDYEASTGYHYLITEMILWAAVVCRARDVSPPPLVLQQLENMLDALAGLLKPDGTLPTIGDLDSGRWLSLESDTDRLISGQDPRGLLGLGATLFERDDWAEATGERWEAAFWVREKKNEAETSPSAARHTPLVTRHIASIAFHDAGWYVMRHADKYLIAKAGGNGAEGWGLHAHNDALSFELAVAGRSLLVDPGSFLYSGNYRARNAFRATAAHNTLSVDGAEINPIPETDLFRLSQSARVRVLRWESDNAYDLLEAEHDGFARRGAIHRRQIYFDKRRGWWLVRDLVAPVGTFGRPNVPTMSDERGRQRGEHAVDIYFHFAPLPILADGLAVRTVCEAGVNLLILPLRRKWLALSQSSGWVSPHYGVRLEAPVLRYSARVALPVEFAFALWPFTGDIVPEEVRTWAEPVLRVLAESPPSR